MKSIFLSALGLLACLALPAQSIFDSLRLAQRGELYFAFGKSDISAQAQATIDSFSNLYKTGPFKSRLRITAHTDSVGSPENNLALSRRRSDAVRKALVKSGVPDNGVDAAFFGEKNPATANATEEGRQRNRRATLELWRLIPMSPYTGQVKDKSTGTGIPATVMFSTKVRRDSVHTDSVGNFAVLLPQDSVVKVEAVAKGYMFGAVMQRIYGTPEMVKRMAEKPVAIMLPPAVPGAKASIGNLFFVGNKDEVLRSSEQELEKVLRFMEINPGLKIEIAGHINAPGRKLAQLEEWEKALSERRAKTVYNYLVKGGIAAERMRYKGYHNLEMLFPNPQNERESEQNRRVEIRVVE